MKEQLYAITEIKNVDLEKLNYSSQYFYVDDKNIFDVATGRVLKNFPFATHILLPIEVKTVSDEDIEIKALQIHNVNYGNHEEDLFNTEDFIMGAKWVRSLYADQSTPTK